MKFSFVGVEKEKKSRIVSRKRREEDESEPELSACFARSAICQRVSSISRTRGSSDSLFTPFKVSGVSRTEALQNCRMLIPRCPISSPREAGGVGGAGGGLGGVGGEDHHFACLDGGRKSDARREIVAAGFGDNLIDS